MSSLTEHLRNSRFEQNFFAKIAWTLLSLNYFIVLGCRVQFYIALKCLQNPAVEGWQDFSSLKMFFILILIYYFAQECPKNVLFTIAPKWHIFMINQCWFSFASPEYWLCWLLLQARKRPHCWRSTQCAIRRFFIRIFLH